MCERTLLEYEEAKSLIQTARREGYPEIGRASVSRFTKGKTPTTETILKQSPGNQLRMIVQLIDRGELHHKAGRHRIPFKGLVQLRRLLAANSGQRVFELLLADRFLPRQVIVASGLTIMAITGLNPETLYSLRPSNIYRQGNSVRISGVKGRADATVDAVLFDGEEATVKVNDRRAILAINRLVENCRAIEDAFGTRGTPLLAGLDYINATPTYYQFDFYKETQVFWQRFGVDSIDFREFRRLAAHVDFLSPGGNLYTVQALLNHKEASTSLIYVNTKIIAELFEANMRRFMRKLEATALFRLNRHGELADRGLTENDVQVALFPPLEQITAKTRVDEWIQMNGDFELKIGIAEIRHCVRQLTYYRQRYETLVSENPLRFVELHLPRIIFCTALREVIKSSAHSGLMQSLERTP